MARRRRPKMRAPEALDGVLGRAGEDRFALHRAPVSQRVWIDAVGARIAERAKPIALERGVLTVRAVTSVWASELSMLSDALLARLRTAGVAVRELRFRVGAIDPPARPPERRVTRRIPPPLPLPRDLAAEVARVPDAELRDAIASAARANLAWQSHVTAADAISEEPRAARAPRGAERGIGPLDRTSPASRGAGRGTRGGD